MKLTLSYLALAGLSLAVVHTVGGCTASAATPEKTRASAQLKRLGNHAFPVTTRSREAQTAFNRGLILAYAFSHHAAEQEFRAAVEADPACAMAHWGVALVNGPHINFPMVPPDRAAKAWDALQRAQALAPQAGPLEQQLIAALATRYANPQPEDRTPLDHAYAAAMKPLWQQHPDNADIATLYAEALMDLHPWDLWTDAGAQPWTSEIVTTLERALELNPEHPGANHLYIHAIEASPHAEKALAAADRLLTLAPDASHLVHMPAHIYARVGRWEQAADSNRRAESADKVFRSAYPRPGFYAMYMAHNTHFLAFSAMMQGRSAEALASARKLVADIPEDFLAEYGEVADGYLIFPSEVLMRFGRWEDILKEPEPAAPYHLSRALWRFTRAVALTSLGRLEEASTEREAFRMACAAVPEDRFFGNNSAADLLAVATHTLDGEMAAKEDRFEEAVDSLTNAIALEDRLRYDEPPDWIQPVRHTLGAVLLRAGRAAEAEQIYREDLKKFPGNGWSLMGLRDALKKQGKTAEAETMDAAFQKAWAGADVKPTATCYCQAED
jgi:tetratricopeptide (TPR) repeat protein